jgi:hypothetical protein
MGFAICDYCDAIVDSTEWTCGICEFDFCSSCLGTHREYCEKLQCLLDRLEQGIAHFTAGREEEALARLFSRVQHSFG